MRAMSEDNEMSSHQKDMNINRLTGELNKVRQQQEDL